VRVEGRHGAAQRRERLALQDVGLTPQLHRVP
jgi:hypothetical protein